MGEDQACCRYVEREAQHSGDQQHHRKGGEVERPLDPQRDHENEDCERQGDRKPHVQQDAGDGHEQDREDAHDTEREADVA